MVSGSFSRVTNSMMTNTFIRDIQRNLTNIEKLQRQISTGKKIEFASDDPIGADKSLNYRQAIEQNTQYSKNVDDALVVANNVDSVLDTMQSVLLRIRDLTVRASNEAPNNQQAMDAMAKEIDTLTEELVHQANQKFEGKFLFSGLDTTTTPFTANREITYHPEVTVAANGNVTLTMPSSYDVNGTDYPSRAITEPGKTSSQPSDPIPPNAGSVKEILINGNPVTMVVPGADPAADPSTANIRVDPTNNTIEILDVGAAGISSTDEITIKFDKIVNVEYHGDTGTREFEISENNRLGVSYAGATAENSSQESVFGQYSGNGVENNSVQIFQKLIDLRDSIYKYSETGSESLEGIQRGIDDVDEFLDNLSNIRAAQGTRVNRLELAKNRLESANINTKELLSAQEDVDMAEAISQFSLLQNVYQSSLAAGARIIQTSLINFLS